MKTCIIFYSHTEFTANIARAIAKILDADTLNLKTKEDLIKKNNLLMTLIKGGSKAILKNKPELAPFDFDPDDYDFIIFGTPVWAWTYAPPFRTFFEQVKFQNKKIATFATHQGKPGNTLKNLKQELSGNDIISERDFLNEKDKLARTLSNARLWASSLKKML